MQIPSPPTDNLYKFMAISGTLLLIVSIIFPIYFGLKLSEKIAFNTADIAVMKDKRELLNDLKNDSPEFLSKLESITELHHQTLRKNIINKQLVKNLWFLFWTGISGMVLGTIIMFYGFSLWYFRVQRYLDNELKNKVNAQSEKQS